MKKLTKSFMAMALGLSLVLAGCSKDDDAITLSDFVGSYEVGVKLVQFENTTLPATLTIAESNGALKATANVSIPAQLAPIGTIEISLNFSDLKSYGATSLGIKAGGFYYKIPEQDLTVGNFGALKFKGTGTEDSDYDGNLTIFSDVVSIKFEISGIVPLGVNLETQQPILSPLTIVVGGPKK
jgi:hypothetical protein